MGYVDNIGINSPKGLFGDVKTTKRTPIIELKSTYGTSALRDIVTVTGSASATNNKIEYALSTGTTTGSNANLSSAERGRYMPGGEGEAGIGIRFNETLTGDEDAKWGYYDDDNGFGFGVDATGNYVFIRRGGTDTKIYQAGVSGWNGDKLDSNGKSGLELDLAEGNIFQINFSWYGYGSVYFSVVLPDDNGNQHVITVHRFAPAFQTSIENPNLPISAEIDNGTGTRDLTMYIGGRQYAVYSPFAPSKRVNSHRVIDKVAVGTTFVPLVTFKRKAGFVAVSARLEGFDIITDANLIYQLRLDSTLTGATYGTPLDTTASETAMEAGNAATAISAGHPTYQGLIQATGNGQNVTGNASMSGLGSEIPNIDPVTLCARVVSGTDATVSAVLRWVEEW